MPENAWEQAKTVHSDDNVTFMSVCFLRLFYIIKISVAIVIVEGELIIDRLSDAYSSPACKLGRMVEEGKIVRLRRGLYETDPETPPYLVANRICEPSYISFEYALMRHSIIPERVVRVTNATCGKRKTKTYSNRLGTFVYYGIPEGAFPVGIEYWGEGDRRYPIATAVKAVCDMLSKMPSTRTRKGLETLMFEDLRFDEDAILELDAKTVLEYSALYRSTTVKTLGYYLEEFA